MSDVEKRVKVTFDADGNKLKEEITTIERSLDKAGQTASKSGGVFSKFGEDVKTGIGQGFGISTVGLVSDAIGKLKEFAVSSVTTGIEFEQSMANVKAISGATGDEFQKLTDFARELGASTMMSASESADAMSFLAMAGWETSEIMAGLPAILDLTIASGSEFATVADIVSDNLTAFGLSAQDATMYSDSLAYAMSNANVNMDTLGESLKYIAPVATSAGFSMQETVASVMMLGDAGIKGSQAGTTLRTVMLNLTGANEKATKKLKELGVAVFDSEGKTRKLSEIMRDLDKATQGLTDAQKANIYNTLVGKTAVAGFSTLMEQGAGRLEEYTAGVYDSAGATEEMAEIMGNTTEGKLKIFNSTLDELKLQLFEGVQPALQGTVEWLTDFVSYLNGSQTSAQQATSEMILFGDTLTGCSQKLIDTIRPFEELQTTMDETLLIAQNMGGQSAKVYEDLLTSTTAWKDQSISLLEQKQEEEWASIQAYSQKYLMADAEEKEQLKNQFDTFYTNKKDLISRREEEINGIITTAKEKNVDLTQEECDRIKTLNSLTMKDLIKIASDSYADQEAMLKAYKNKEVSITAENAQHLVNQATKTRDNILKDAQKRLDGELKSANSLKRVGAISEQEYNNMVSDAQSNYNKIADEAEKGFGNVRDAIIENITEAGGHYSKASGELTDKHGRVVATFKDNPPKTKIEATDNASRKIDAVNRKMNNLNGKKATVTINTREKTTKSISWSFGGNPRSGDIAQSYMMNPLTKFTGMQSVRGVTGATINYNGDFNFENRADIDYFLRQTAKAIDRHY